MTPSSIDICWWITHVLAMLLMCWLELSLMTVGPNLLSISKMLSNCILWWHLVLAFLLLSKVEGKAARFNMQYTVDIVERVTYIYSRWYEYRVGKKNWTCLSIDNSAMVTRRKACDMSKVLECCRQKGPNLHSKWFKYSFPNLHKSSLPLKLGICLHSHVPEYIELKNSLP